MYEGRRGIPVLLALARGRSRVRHPDRAVRGPDLGLRAGPGRHRLRHLRPAARLLHPLGQPGRPPRPLPGPRVRRRERPALRLHLHGPATGELLAGRLARPRHRPRLPAPRGSRAVRILRMRTCRRTGSRPPSANCWRSRSAARGDAARGPRARAEDAEEDRRRRRPVLARRAGDPRPDRAPGVRRLVEPARGGQAGQGRAPAPGNAGDGPGRRGPIAGQAAPGGVGAPDGRRARPQLRFCDDLSRREARNFYWSFRLLPAERRAGDVGALRLHAAHRRPRRRARRPPRRRPGRSDLALRPRRRARAVGPTPGRAFPRSRTRWPGEASPRGIFTRSSTASRWI